MLCIGLQVQKTLVEMVKTGATGINFDLELPLKVGGGKRVLWRGGEMHCGACCLDAAQGIPWQKTGFERVSIMMQGLCVAKASVITQQRPLIYIVMFVLPAAPASGKRAPRKSQGKGQRG